MCLAFSPPYIKHDQDIVSYCISSHIPGAHLSLVPIPDLAPGWSTVWCHPCCVSVLFPRVRHTSSLLCDTKFLSFYTDTFAPHVLSMCQKMSWGIILLCPFGGDSACSDVEIIWIYIAWSWGSVLPLCTLLCLPQFPPLVLGVDFPLLALCAVISSWNNIWIYTGNGELGLLVLSLVRFFFLFACFTAVRKFASVIIASRDLLLSSTLLILICSSQ